MDDSLSENRGAETRNSGPRGPFIMPNGQTLSLYLLTNDLLRPGRGGGGAGGSRKTHRRPGALKEPKEGWTKAPPRVATFSPASAAGLSEAEAAEAEALARVGQRRRRRWLNDRLLRDMAGSMTAAEMEALFKPVPFGERCHSSAFAQATSREHIQLWELFRSVDMDRESRVLRKWEEHVQALAWAGHTATASPAVAALRAWAAVSSRARQALKRAPLLLVDQIEGQMLHFIGQEGAAAVAAASPHGERHTTSSSSGSSSQPRGEELVLELEDGFQRLLAHGLAEFHALASATRQLADGSKRVVVRRRRVPAAAEQPGSSTSSSIQPVGQPAGSAGTGGCEAELAEEQQHDGPAEPVASQAPPAARPLLISCCDILLLLEDQPEHGLNAQAVHEAYCRPPDVSPSTRDAQDAAGLNHRVHVVSVH